jgi:hypothetical protein
VERTIEQKPSQDCLVYFTQKSGIILHIPTPTMNPWQIDLPQPTIYNPTISDLKRKTLLNYKLSLPPNVVASQLSRDICRYDDGLLWEFSAAFKTSFLVVRKVPFY